MTMGNMMDHIEAELSALDDDDYRKKLAPEIKALAKKAAEIGPDSGAFEMFANSLAESLRLLMRFEPISPVRGKDEEWAEAPGGDSPMWQNKRCSALFRREDGTCSYLDGVKFVEKERRRLDGTVEKPEGSAFTGTFTDPNVGVVSSSIDVKMPFEPRTFEVDVISHEVAPDDWEYELVDPRQYEDAKAWFAVDADARRAV